MAVNVIMSMSNAKTSKRRDVIQESIENKD